MERRGQFNFVHKYPIGSFFILAVLLGSGLVFLVYQEIIPAQFALSSALSATIAGIIITAITEGKAGLKSLFRRILIWRAGAGYWIFALFFLVPAVLVGSSFNPFFNGQVISLTDLKISFDILPMFIVFFIVAGLGQDIGWTGFLLPRLQAHYTSLESALIRAGLILAWHLPLLLFSLLQPSAFPDFPYGDWIVQKGFLITLLSMALLSLPWSIIFTWLFNNTKGSLLLVAAFHGSEVWLAYLLGMRSKNINNLWGYGLIILMTAIIITVITGPLNFSRKHKRIVS